MMSQMARFTPMGFMPQISAVMMSPEVPLTRRTSPNPLRHHRFYGDSFRFLCFSTLVFLVGFSTPFWVHVEVEIPLSDLQPTPSPETTNVTSARPVVVWKKRTTARATAVPETWMNVTSVVLMTSVDRLKLKTTHSMGLWMMCTTVGLNNVTSCDGIHAIPFTTKIVAARWFQTVRALECLCVIGVVTSCVCLAIAMCTSCTNARSRSRFLEILSAISGLLGFVGTVVYMMSVYSTDHLIASSANTSSVRWYFSWALVLNVVGVSFIVIASTAMAAFKTFKSAKIGSADDFGSDEESDEDEEAHVSAISGGASLSGQNRNASFLGEPGYSCVNGAAPVSPDARLPSSSATDSRDPANADGSREDQGVPSGQAFSGAAANAPFPLTGAFALPLSPQLLAQSAGLANPAFVLQQLGYLLDEHGDLRLADALMMDPPPSYREHLDPDPDLALSVLERRSHRVSQLDVAHILGLRAQGDLRGQGRDQTREDPDEANVISFPPTNQASEDRQSGERRGSSGGNRQSYIEMQLSQTQQEQSNPCLHTGTANSSHESRRCLTEGQEQSPGQYRMERYSQHQISADVPTVQTRECCSDC